VFYNRGRSRIFHYRVDTSLKECFIAPNIAAIAAKKTSEPNGPFSQAEGFVMSADSI
jgi:hypothetical protein